MDKQTKERIESATGQQIVRWYSPSGLYTWLTFADGRMATYYTGSNRVVCDEPKQYAIDVVLA